jgi:hypothetical protein
MALPAASPTEILPNDFKPIDHRHPIRHGGQLKSEANSTFHLRSKRHKDLKSNLKNRRFGKIEENPPGWLVGLENPCWLFSLCTQTMQHKIFIDTII